MLMINVDDRDAMHIDVLEIIRGNFERIRINAERKHRQRREKLNPPNRYITNTNWPKNYAVMAA